MHAQSAAQLHVYTHIWWYATHLICSKSERYFSLYSFLSLRTRATSIRVRPSSPIPAPPSLSSSNSLLSFLTVVSSSPTFLESVLFSSLSAVREVSVTSWLLHRIDRGRVGNGHFGGIRTCPPYCYTIHYVWGGGGGKEGVKEQRTMCVGCLNRYSLFSDELFILSNDFGQFHWQFEALLRDSLQSPPPLQTDA